jgi:hypothetical protein
MQPLERLLEDCNIPVFEAETAIRVMTALRSTTPGLVQTNGSSARR